jgi:Protein of unknown function (DUF2459)
VRRGWLLLCLASLAGCSVLPPAEPISGSDRLENPVAVYVARRKWHIDVGFAAADLDPPLAPINAEFATARYLFFGFGDRHYLLTKSKNAPLLLRALWPGPALLLVTAIDGTPAAAFGQSQVIRIELSAAQAHALQSFIRTSMVGTDLTALAPGPYPESAFYAAAQQYWALHTCNTWVAEALRAADQPVHSRGVVFASQLWIQVRRLAQLQGGLVPSWHTTVVESPGGTTTVVLAGAGGLELLMQPLSNPAATSAAAAMSGVADTFIFDSSAARHAGHHTLMVAEAPRSKQRRIS